MELREIDAWMLTTKKDNNYIIDWLESHKKSVVSILDTEPNADNKETVTCMNQLFIILERNLWAELMPDNQIEITCYKFPFIKNRKIYTRLEDTVSNDYKAFLIQTYKTRFMNHSFKVLPTTTKIKPPIGYGVIEKTDDMTEKKKEELQKGL